MKNICAHTHLVTRKRPLSIKQNALVPIFCQKNVNFLKNTVFSCPFYQYSNEKPPAVMPIFSQLDSGVTQTSTQA